MVLPNGGSGTQVPPSCLVQLRLYSLPWDRGASAQAGPPNLSVNHRFLLWPKAREKFQVLQGTHEHRYLWAIVGGPTILQASGR